MEALDRGLSPNAEQGEKTVAWSNQLAEESRQKHMRAGSRLNSRVEVKVEWEEAGKILEATGYTVDISPKGCLAIVAQGFPLGQKMRVINLATGKATEAVLIWRGHEGRKGWELGLEINNEGGDFWGVDF